MNDESYFGDKHPTVRACLIHESDPATSLYVSKHPDWAGVRYGLCEHCVMTLAMYPSYQKFIDGVVDRRLTKLKKERENAT